MEPNPKLKRNLYNLNEGYYLSKNDPLFWKKLLDRRPENKEAMYHLALELEIEAKKYLNKYYLTKLDKYLILYRKIIRQASDLIKSSLNKGYFSARREILRMDQEIDSNEERISEIINQSDFNKNDIILFVLAVLVGIGLAAFAGINYF